MKPTVSGIDVTIPAELPADYWPPRPWCLQDAGLTLDERKAEAERTQQALHTLAGKLRRMF